MLWMKNQTVEAADSASFTSVFLSVVCTPSTHSSLPASLLCSSFTNHLFFEILFVVSAPFLYFENSVPLFFKHRHANQAAHTQFLFLQREGGRGGEWRRGGGERVDDRSTWDFWSVRCLCRKERGLLGLNERWKHLLPPLSSSSPLLPQVDYMDENEEYFQRQASHRQSRRRFRKINQKGERQTIIDTVDPYPAGKPPTARSYSTVSLAVPAFLPSSSSAAGKNSFALFRCGCSFSTSCCAIFWVWDFQGSQIIVRLCRPWDAVFWNPGCPVVFFELCLSLWPPLCWVVGAGLCKSCCWLADFSFPFAWLSSHCCETFLSTNESLGVFALAFKLYKLTLLSVCVYFCLGEKQHIRTWWVSDKDYLE